MNQISKSLLIAVTFLLYLNAVWALQHGKPVKVEIRETKTGYEILRGGRPYFIKGAGGTYNMEKLQAAGGKVSGHH